MAQKAKKFLSLVLVVIILLTAVPISNISFYAHADGWGYSEPQFKSGDWGYNIVDGYAEIAGYFADNCPDVLCIPSQIDGYTVKAIGECAFLKGIDIDAALCNAVDVSEFIIPNTVEKIDIFAFVLLKDDGNNKFKITVDSDNKNYKSVNGALLSADGKEFYTVSSAYCSETYSVPSGVEKICSRAFLLCESMIDVTIPKSVKQIESYAFSGSGLPNYDGVCYADDWLLSGDPSVNKYTIREGTRHIADGAFNYSYNLEEITIPSSVRTIGEDAFRECENLKSITISNGVTTIGDYAFCGCTQLEHLYIPASVTKIGSGTFYRTEELIGIKVDAANQNYCDVDGCLLNKDKTKLIYCPRNSIGDRYTIPDSVVIICNGAMSEAYSVDALVVPLSVLVIEEGSVPFCDYVYYAGTAEQWAKIEKSQDEYHFDTTEFYYNYCYHTDNDGDNICDICGKNLSYTISVNEKIEVSLESRDIAYIKFVPENDGLYSVESSAFNGAEIKLYDANKKLISERCQTYWEWTEDCGYKYILNCRLNMNETYYFGTSYSDDEESGSYTVELKSLPVYDYDINEDGSLIITKYNDFKSNVTIPSQIDGKKVTGIGYGSFEYYDALESVYIPMSVKAIDGYAFNKCENLTSVTLANGLEAINQYAFHDCPQLKEITIPKSVSYIGEYALGYYYDEDESKVEDLVIKGFTNSAAHAYSVDYGFKFESFGTTSQWIYRDYSGGIEITRYNGVDKTVTIPSQINGNTVVRIGEDSFKNRGIVERISIPSSVESMGDYAFYGCSALKEVAIPDSIKAIGGYAFDGCENLTSVTFGKGLEIIGYSAFSDCNALREVIVPESVKTIDGYAFAYCINLMNVTLVNGLEGINRRAFFGCSQLKEITIPESISYIEECALGYYYDDDYDEVKVENFTINGCAGSEAEYYAKDNGFDFHVIESGHKHNHTSTITTPPTCTKNGVKTYTCSCGDSYTEIIPASGHREATVKGMPATCTKNGLTDGTKCLACGEILKAQKTIPATGNHTYGAWKTTKTATCTSDGKQERTCSVCGKTETKTIAKSAHKFITVKGTPATCAKDGKTDGTKCSVCGAVIKAQTTIKATGHSYSVWKVTKKATYTAAGTQSRTCSKCKATETKTIAKLKTTAITKCTFSVKAATYTGKALKPAVTVKNGKTTLKAGTHYTVTYKNNTKIGKATAIITGVEKNGYSGIKTLTFNIFPANVKNLKVSSQTGSSVKLTWSKVAGATGYRVFRHDGKKWVKIADTKNITYTVSKLKSGTSYKYAVRAYTTVSKTTYWSAVQTNITTATSPATPNLKATAGTKQALLSWNKISGATGYEVWMSTKKNGSYSKVATIKKNVTVKYTKKSLKKGSTYYFKVRAYKTVDGKNIYSAYSAVKSIKSK